MDQDDDPFRITQIQLDDDIHYTRPDTREFKKNID